MAKVKATTGISFVRKPKRKRPGIHSKCKASRSKMGKNYVKLYKGQGK
jgi:hypothetical protein